MDDGEDHGDFALLNRKDGTIYSISHEEQRTLVIPAQPVTIAAPKKLRHDIEKLDAGGVPDVDGKKVSRYYLFTNGTRCTEIYAVEGFYDDAVSALAVFSRTLAGCSCDRTAPIHRWVLHTPTRRNSRPAELLWLL